MPWIERVALAIDLTFEKVLHMGFIPSPVRYTLIVSIISSPFWCVLILLYTDKDLDNTELSKKSSKADNNDRKKARIKRELNSSNLSRFN